MVKLDIYLESELGKWYAQSDYAILTDNYFTRDEDIHSVLIHRGAKVDNKVVPKSKRAFSICWQSKIESEIVSKYDYFLNIHPGYLPIGRGSFPIFWSIFLNQKAGVTIHQITDKMDFGPILFRNEVKFGSHQSSGELAKQIFIEEKKLLILSLEVLRFSRELDFLKISDEIVGINRKKSDFYNLLNDPPLETMSKQEIRRLMLAIKHEKYPEPSWFNFFQTDNLN
jgi:hypothetical protein